MVTCPKCGYAWTTRSAAAWITCPGCQRKFKRPAPVVEVILANVDKPSWCSLCGRRVSVFNVCLIDGEAAFVCAECLGSRGGSR